MVRVVSDRRGVLVTGAGGFLGSNIVARAHAQGRDVIGGYRGAVRPGGVLLDVCDGESVDAAFRATQPSIVIHCAAYGVNYADQDFERALEVNVRGSLRVLAAAARYGVRRFVHVGSAFEYGNHGGPIREDAQLNPTAMYGSTKAAATILLCERAKALGVPLLVVRPFGIWGPGQGAHHLIPQVIAACCARSPLKLTPCEVIRDYTYVDDMADDILSLALTCATSELIVNLGTGVAVVLRDFVLAVAGILDGAHLMQFGALPYRRTEMQSVVADVARLRHLVGRRAATSLLEGVRRMVPR